MTLEARVDALERDVASLRIEVHGWATFAISADRRAGGAGEFLTLIHQDVNQIKQDVGGMKTDMAGLKTDVAGLRTATDEHTQILSEHTQILAEHGQMLREILGRLA
jgi:outer membrane murein-binding lipoprotein Lpp